MDSFSARLFGEDGRAGRGPAREAAAVDAADVLSDGVERSGPGPGRGGRPAQLAPVGGSAGDAAGTPSLAAV